MPYTFDGLKSISISQEQVDNIVSKEIRHPDYTRSVDRARIFYSYYESEFSNNASGDNALLADKELIIPRGSTESRDAYDKRLNRTRVMPLESKFLSGQKRIYDDKKVNRTFPEKSKEFWDYKQQNFDDKGSTITEFYRDKALFVKETLGFGAIVTDIVLDSNSKTVFDSEGKPVPYTFLVRPHEIWNFGKEKGVITFVVLRQQFFNEVNEPYYKWTSYTPERIKVWKSEKEAEEKELIVDIPNPFKEVPVRFLYGETDSLSGFNIGRPRRWHLSGLYNSVAELFYDLMQGTQLFAHPIPVMPESVAKQMAGVINSDDKFDSSVVTEKVGFAIIVPDDMPITGNLLYQADMKGLEHLTEVIFGKMMSLIFTLAMYRDKSIVKSNVSANSKQMDSADERGLLAATASDMEVIEKEIAGLMCKVRGEDDSDLNIIYSKNYDLSSAQEIFSDIVEMAQYHAITPPVFKYLLKEYLSKRSAPKETIDEAIKWIDDNGIPNDVNSIDEKIGIETEDIN